MPDLIIIGAGASGLMAAIAAGQEGAGVCLLEAGPRVGRKIAASGNGRCNYTHRTISMDHYHTTAPYALLPAMTGFDEGAVMDFFTQLGLPPYIDDRDRVYPYARKAAMVTDALRQWALQLGVTIKTDCRVTALEGQYGAFTARGQGFAIQGTTALVACGGEAAPQLGGTSDGYRLLEGFGHRSTARHPAICPILTEKDPIRGCQGVRWWAQAHLQAGGRDLLANGEFLFNEDGLSGPLAFDLAYAIGVAGPGECSLVLDLLPDVDRDWLLAHMTDRQANLAFRPIEDFLSGLMPKPLGLPLLRQLVQGKMTDPAAALPADFPDRFVKLAKAYPIRVTGLRPYKDAQVTAGGIDLADFDPDSLMSWLVPGLFACGEVLDVTGDCGGYNLQWAWASGRLAGLSAARYAGKGGQS
ncbi:NAD(P)/FAD-dependent oxidoreductase [Peptococcus simiae]|uniref:NAD(P)/FAD-dependent oxidoreductase n=1 Tax=Peptococcus simiae TaxID=1643805 RepID=UPI00397FC6DF